ncbi:MAG: aromatic amino acid transport family protein [bacterium]|nr:aromatic amino acid transport family protein [bacterium]
MSKTIYATVTLIGMIVGVGIFGVPYVAAQAGFWTALFWLLVLGGVNLLMNVFYGEVVMATPGKHRMVGYADIYLGGFWKSVTAFINVISFWAAQVAYIIVGGKFLYLLLNGIFGGTELVYNLIFFVVMSLLIYGGLKLFEEAELIMTVLLIAAVLFIFGRSLPGIDLDNFMPAVTDWGKFFLPYGVILFSLTGASAIPEMRDILSGNRAKMKKSIWFGTIIAILLTLLFMVAIVGLTGHKTTEESLEGLRQLGGYENLVLAGIIFGILAIATSFLVLGLNLKGIFQYDYKRDKNLSWFLAVAPPGVVFLLGATDFIKVIDFSGSILSSLSGLLILGLFLKVMSLRKTGLKSWFWPICAGVVGLIFIVGMLSSFGHF